MPTKAASATATTCVANVASTRILRLAFGAALSLWISQAVGWDLSFLAPVVTMMLLAMPLSRPKPKIFIVVALALTLSVYGSFIFLPMLLDQKLAGLLLLALAMFHSFYFTARGGSSAAASLVTVGVAVTVAIGTVSIDALLGVANGVMVGAAVGAGVAMLSHRLIPDQPQELPAKPVSKPDKAVRADLATARHDAIRSLTMVMPIVIWFILSSASAANVAVLIKVAAMGQEISKCSTRDAARGLIVSTLAGGLAAIVAWQVLSIWPSLTMYALLVALAGLLFGPRIFEGPGMRKDAATWSYAFLTMLIVLAPAAVDSGTDAGARFYDRLFMFGWATLYAVGAVYIFDAFWKRPEP